MKTKHMAIGLVAIAIIAVAGCIQQGQNQYTWATEDESLEIARSFVENSPTYLFDGSDLAYVETITIKCPSCWRFVFSFTSSHAGYGDRTGQAIAQVITPHTARINVGNGTVNAATLDDEWDMHTQEPTENTQIANPASVYCIEQGGELVIYDFADGQKGYCKLADGSECEEWEFFRSEGQNCLK